MKGVEDLLFNVCDKDVAGCEFLGRSCASCPKKRKLDIHPYILFLMHTRNLIERGYPVGKDDLSLDTWTDLIRVENAIVKAIQKKHKQKPLPRASAPKTPKLRGKK